MKLKVDKFLIAIFLIAILIRIYEFFNIYIISRDSPLYLYQAMAIAKKNFHLLKLCKFSSRVKEINLFPLTIVPFYHLFKNWEVAGKLVSFLSSIFSLVLLYFILRRFFKGAPVYLTLLIFAFNPVIVKESGEILRESYFSFLVLCGILFFLKAQNRSVKYQIFFYFLSNVFWILSSWVRVEGIFFIFFSFIYLVISLIFTSDKKRIFYSIIYFSIIPFISLFILAIYISFYKGFFLEEIKSKLLILNPFTQPIAQSLKEFKYLNTPIHNPYFWDIVKQNLWLIALGTTLFYKLIPALHFSNLLFLFFGFKNLKKTLKEKPLLWYFLVITIGYLVELWYFTFTHWYMEKRYMLALLYCLSPFIAHGILNIKGFLEQKFRLSSKAVSIGLVIYIVCLSSIKIFKPVRKELLYLKKMALDISKIIPYNELKGCSQKACTNLIFSRDRRILFYISSYSKVPLCPKNEDRIFYAKLKNFSDEQIVHYIFSKKFKIAILEKSVFGNRTETLKKQLEKLGIKTYIVE